MNGDLDLSSEELELLKAEGLIPPDWEPSQGDLMDAPGPLSEGNLLDSPGVPQPAPGDLMSRAPLSAEEFQPSVKGGIDLLSRYEREAPSIQNPAIQRFQDIALRWLPTDDKALQGARARAQASADQLARLRLAAETQAQQYPWETFVAEMLAPRETPGFTSALSATMKAVGEEKRKRAGLARELGLKEAEAGATRATQEERAEMDRIRAGADLVQASAQMQHYANQYKTAGASSEFGKRLADLGVNRATPEARRAFMYEQAKNNPAIINALATNSDPASPGYDPFSPTFAKLVADENLRLLKLKETTAGVKLTKEEAQTLESVARTEKVKQDIATGKTEIAADPLLAGALGVPISPADPYQGLSSTGKNQLYLANTRAFEKDMDTIQKSVDAGGTKVPAVSQMKELLDKGLKTGVQYTGVLGAAKYLDEDLRRFDQLSKEIVPFYRAVGSGATSDFEVRMYQAAAPGIDKPVTANREAINAILVLNRLQKMKLEVLDNYFSANKHTRGFDTAWNKYLESTFFDKQGKVTFPKDPNTFRSFTDWYKKSKAEPVAPEKSGWSIRRKP